MNSWKTSMLSTHAIAIKYCFSNKQKYFFQIFTVILLKFITSPNQYLFSCKGTTQYTPFTPYDNSIHICNTSYHHRHLYHINVSNKESRSRICKGPFSNNIIFFCNPIDVQLLNQTAISLKYFRLC